MTVAAPWWPRRRRQHRGWRPSCARTGGGARRHTRGRLALAHSTAPAAPDSGRRAARRLARAPAPPPCPCDGGCRAVIAAAAAHTQTAVPRRHPHWRGRGTRSAGTRQATQAAGRRQRTRRATCGTKRRLPRRASAGTRARISYLSRAMAAAAPRSPRRRSTNRRKWRSGAHTAGAAAHRTRGRLAVERATARDGGRLAARRLFPARVVHTRRQPARARPRPPAAPDGGRRATR